MCEGYNRGERWLGEVGCIPVATSFIGERRWMEDLRVVTPRRLMGVLRAAASPFPEVGCQGLDEEDRQRQTGHL